MQRGREAALHKLEYSKQNRTHCVFFLVPEKNDRHFPIWISSRTIMKEIEQQNKSYIPPPPEIEHKAYRVLVHSESRVTAVTGVRWWRWDCHSDSSPLAIFFPCSMSSFSRCCWASQISSEGSAPRIGGALGLRGGRDRFVRKSFKTTVLCDNFPGKFETEMN